MASTLYTQADLDAMNQQLRKRWVLLAIPCCILLAGLVSSLVIRLQWLSILTTIAIGAILIAGYDLALKPLRCYRRHLNTSLHGRTRECELPFVALSENIDVVDGVRFRQLLCADVDGKGRPYDRLFYFDAEKEFPPTEPGAMLHIVHYDLNVANIYPV
ncbi:MAG: hypothetical protein IJB81_06895 [Clostridia bacterium]|nr:hypothetical protein [Clostridia bacterium]